MTEARPTFPESFWRRTPKSTRLSQELLSLYVSVFSELFNVKLGTVQSQDLLYVLMFEFSEMSTEMTGPTLGAITVLCCKDCV